MGAINWTDWLCRNHKTSKCLLAASARTYRWNHAISNKLAALLLRDLIFYETSVAGFPPKMAAPLWSPIHIIEHLKSSNRSLGGGAFTGAMMYYGKGSRKVSLSYCQVQIQQGRQASRSYHKKSMYIIRIWYDMKNLRLFDF